jgi:hypothetical protein
VTPTAQTTSAPVAYEVRDGTITTTSVHADDVPAQMELLSLEMGRNSQGWLGVLGFRSWVALLRDWDSTPVTHTVSLVLQPPSGDAFTMTLSGDGTGVMSGTVAGHPVTDSAASIEVVGGQVRFQVPMSVGVRPGWTVYGEVRVEAAQPLQIDGATGWVARTDPVPVGALTGEGPKGVVALPPQGLAAGRNAQPWATSSMPPGTRPTAAHVLGSGAGLVAVVTMDAPPHPARVGGQPLQTQLVRLRIFLPPPFGIRHAVTITWSAISPPGSNVASGSLPATVTDDQQHVLGQVPVQVAGRDVRFLLGQFTKTATASTAPTAPSRVGQPIRFGTFQGAFTTPAGSTEIVTDCSCPNGAPDGLAPGTTLTEPWHFDINGHYLAISRPSGSPAYGWIEPDGDFLARNDTDRYTGFLVGADNGNGFTMGLSVTDTRLINPAHPSALRTPTPETPDHAVLASTRGAPTGSSTPTGAIPVTVKIYESSPYGPFVAIYVANKVTYGTHDRNGDVPGFPPRAFDQQFHKMFDDYTKSHPPDHVEHFVIPHEDAPTDMFSPPPVNQNATLPSPVVEDANQTSNTAPTTNGSNDWGIQVESSIFAQDGTGATVASPTVQVTGPR